MTEWGNASLSVFRQLLLWGLFVLFCGVNLFHSSFVLHRSPLIEERQTHG